MSFADDCIDFFVDHIMNWVMLLCIMTIPVSIAFIGYELWMDSHAPEFSLKKDEWRCAQQYPHTVTTMIMSGKVMVPIVYTHMECVEWVRK